CVDAAAPADEKVGGGEAPAVSRDLGRIANLDANAACRIDRGARAVPPAKRAGAGAQWKRARIDARLEPTGDVPAVASTEHRCLFTAAPGTQPAHCAKVADLVI